MAPGLGAVQDRGARPRAGRSGGPSRPRPCRARTCRPSRSTPWATSASWRKVAIFNLPPQQARVLDADRPGKRSLTIAPEQVHGAGIDAASQDPVWQVDLSAPRPAPGATGWSARGSASSDPFVVGQRLYRTGAGRGAEELLLPALPGAAAGATRRCGRASASTGGRRLSRPSSGGLGSGWTTRQEAALELEGGWHDAGNYDMYVASTAVAAQTLLLAYEWAPALFPDGQSLNIPESGNGSPTCWTRPRGLRWILSMQEPARGRLPPPGGDHRLVARGTGRRRHAPCAGWGRCPARPRPRR